jgi:3',5'-nucleoside bisphosphate phosphatase
MRTYRAELHVHTVLSPCAEVEMIPPLIVQEAVDRGIDLIAITDHNATTNIAAVQRAARDTGLVVLPGMEVQTIEEVHVLCLFDTLEQVQVWQDEVDCKMPPLENNIELFGEQFVVDYEGEFIRREPRLLLTSAELSIDDVYERVTALGGLAIPAHVDRKAFGLFANLGLISPIWPVAALEISRHLPVGQAVQRYRQLQGYPLIQSGDVHRLEEFLGVNRFTLDAPTIAEIRKALAGEDDRAFVVAS